MARRHTNRDSDLTVAMTATLLLSGEAVLRCGYCGAMSTDSLRGTEGWTLIKPNARALSAIRDCCPACAAEMGYKS
jgi:predicted regulator of Ras-like GTPase activity (Roadblock/LC7/MglB family)